MRTIHKHLIRSGPTIARLELPEGFKILSFQMQGLDIAGWFEVDTAVPLLHVWFENVGTGHQIPEDGTYVATVQDGIHVWHIYRLFR